MRESRWVLDEVFVAVHGMLIAEHGGSLGIRDKGLLESVLARPRQPCSYQPQSTIFERAAAYGFGLARNPPFIDGDKRSALAVAAIFLDLNGFSLDVPEPQAVVVIGRLAAGDLFETELAEWIRDSSVRRA